MTIFTHFLLASLASLAASSNLAIAIALPQSSSPSTHTVICSNAAGKIDFGSNIGITAELDSWVQTGGATDGSGSDVTRAVQQNNFPVYYGSHAGENITVTLVSVLRGYYVPLEGIKGAASSVWQSCIEGGNQADVDGNYVDVGEYARWGNCDDEQLLVGVWKFGAADLALCAWNPKTVYCPYAAGCSTNPGGGQR
ncbi:hypothetical protein K491DRAFT_710270 [Lophiostoma macrostomum CBS 122681]|uniref:Uncharacterized protein n=1 Tax=Lophiostoma macrostomum CBS 122681 TaxID=1314788 RepID=A0A6A6TRA0_9PLEO|nr:hypothetical protein K491DRAFT_710270 [Lophiostoma macrostomum CBS 122681]